jgi:hypothetical protein
VTPLPAGQVVNVPQPPNAPYDVDPVFMAQTQRLLGGMLLAVFAVTILVPLALVSGGSWDNVKEYLQIVLPAEVGLLGSVIGFYFGSRTGED